MAKRGPHKSSAAAKKREEAERMSPGRFWTLGAPAYSIEEFMFPSTPPRMSWKVMGPSGHVLHVLDIEDAKNVCKLMNEAHEEGTKAGLYMAATKRSQALKEAVRLAAEQGRKGGRRKPAAK